MILITYVRHTFEDNKKKLDYTSVNTIEEFVNWFLSQGDRYTYRLQQRNKVLSQDGWNKLEHPMAFLMQVYNSDQKVLTTIDKIVSDEGVLFENIKHCSNRIIDCMALKCVKI